MKAFCPNNDLIFNFIYFNVFWKIPGVCDVELLCFVNVLCLCSFMGISLLLSFSHTWYLFFLVQGRHIFKSSRANLTGNGFHIVWHHQVSCVDCWTWGQESYCTRTFYSISFGLLKHCIASMRACCFLHSWQEADKPASQWSRLQFTPWTTHRTKQWSPRVKAGAQL